MRPALSELLRILELEPIEENIFRGQSQDLGWGAVFGGQVVGQALTAATRTAPTDRLVHSLHASFLRIGDVRQPVIYVVDRTRDGASFTSRRVTAIQHGHAILTLAASFHVEEPGLDHQAPMPSAPEPLSVPGERELAEKLLRHLPPRLKEQIAAERPFELRLVDPVDPLAPAPRPPERQVWYRVPEALPDDQALHRTLLAYASDFHFLTTALQPHGVSWLSPGMQVASLDHAMWFHRPLRVDDWLLHSVESPSASGARGLVSGRFYDRAGHLVASTMQEGLIRQRAQRASPS